MSLIRHAWRIRNAPCAACPKRFAIKIEIRVHLIEITRVESEDLHRCVDFWQCAWLAQ
jgi:hypothetical protein